MNIAEFAFAGFLEPFQKLAFIFTHGGWLAFVGLFGFILFLIYRDETVGQFKANQDWMFLEIKPPKINETSMLAVEQIFSQMHSLHGNLTFAEIWVEGKIQLWYSLELVSFGGKISFILRIPRKMKATVESAFYAQYPDCELTEVEDYLKNVEYHPGHSDFEIFGTELKYTEDMAFPIKTYREFEHPNSAIPEEKIIDPLSGIFEALSVIEPHEFMGLQILIQPLGDEEWKPRSEQKAKEIMGEEAPHASGLMDMILRPFNAFANFKLSGLLSAGGGHGATNGEEKPEVNFMKLSDIEKERVTQIQRKMGKPGYKTKIRFLYMAPKDRFDNTKKNAITGGFRPFASINYNKLKPDLAHTWTQVNYKISPTLEAPYLRWSLHEKKEFIFRGYKRRDIWIGLPQYIMNIEELATLYHLPITTDKSSAGIDKISSKKVQPPTNLPVG